MAKARRTYQPTHVVVLDKLQASVEARQLSHQRKCGDGVEETREYNRLVGRVRECKALLQEISDLRTQLRTDDELGD